MRPGQTSEAGKPRRARTISGQQSMNANENSNNRRGEKKKIVNRKNPERAPRIELAKISGIALRIEKNAGDQEAGQNEKQINASPTKSPSRASRQGRACDHESRNARVPPGISR